MPSNATTPSSFTNTTNPNSTNFSQLKLATYVSSFAVTMFSLALLSLFFRKICITSLNKSLYALAHFETWFALSVSFTMFNKFVFTYWGSGEFNLPFFLTSIHMTVKFFCMLIYVKLFQKKIIIWPTCRQLLTIYIPIGALTGLDIALSNLAVSFAAVSLVVVTKTMGIVFTLSISVLLGLQKCTTTLLLLVIMIAGGSFMALWREPDFQLAGVLISALSSMCGALRWVMTQSASQREKASVQTLILFTAPAGIKSSFLFVFGETYHQNMYDVQSLPEILAYL
jgi:hypothetical protein